MKLDARDIAILRVLSRECRISKAALADLTLDREMLQDVIRRKL